MLACRPVGSSKLTLLAWADRATVFGVTDRQDCGCVTDRKIVLEKCHLPTNTNSCSGHVVQVIFVYLLVTWQESTFWFKKYPKDIKSECISNNWDYVKAGFFEMIFFSEISKLSDRLNCLKALKNCKQKR